MTQATFPDVTAEARTPQFGASRWTIWKTRVQVALLRLLHRLGLPGFVRSMELDDKVTGQQIRVHVSPLATTILVDGRSYHFSRLTGRLTGTGMCLTCSPVSCRQAGNAG